MDEDEYEEYDVDGDVLGDDVLGAGTDIEVIGARRKRKLPRLRRKTIKVRRKPAWRRQLAPGVPQPGYGLEPLPLTPSANAGVFTAAVSQINFEARPQAPFRAERLLASVRRTGAAGTIILAQNIFVGRSLQQVEVGEFDVEFFSPTAFGVRLNLVQADPGVLIRIQCRANPVPAGADTVAVSLMFLGHTAR